MPASNDTKPHSKPHFLIRLHPLQSSLRLPYGLALLGASVMFFGAVYLGNALGLAACPLCILQRMASLGLMLAALLGLLLIKWPAGRLCSHLLMLLASASGAAVAAYQTYIQRVANDIQCSGEAAWWELLVDWAGEQSPLLFQASGLCSDPAWKLLGLSLAEYSLLAFSLLTLLSLFALLRRKA